MSAHTVTAEWDRHGGVSYRFTCTAPAEALCHSVYGADCACEEWREGGVEDGKPYHVVEEWDYEARTVTEVRHWGTFNRTECNLRDWFENTDEALVGGSVTFPVEDEWQGDYYAFTAVAPLVEAQARPLIGEVAP